MPPPLLSVRDLDVESGDQLLLHGVSLELAAGELVAVAGPSGCGKTTLLRTLAGLVDPAAGQVLLSGRSASDVGWPRFRRRVTVVEQQPVMLPGDVAANLARPWGYDVSHGAFPEDRAVALLEALGVGGGRMTQAARTLSVGQAQRVSLVRALLLEPQVMLLDEPTSALDPDATEAVETLFREQARTRGLAALIVTHSAEQARRWCTRTLDLTPFLAAGVDTRA